MDAKTIYRFVDTSDIAEDIKAAFMSYQEANNRISWERGATRGAKVAAARRLRKLADLCSRDRLHVWSVIAQLDDAAFNRCL